MDNTEKLYVPVTFKESYAAIESVQRIERAFPDKRPSEVRRHIFRVGLQQLSVQVFNPEDLK